MVFAADDDGLAHALGLVGGVDIRGPGEDVRGGLVEAEPATGAFAVVDADAGVDHKRGLGECESLGDGDCRGGQGKGHGMAGRVHAGVKPA